jgi:hypothetical protein
LTIGDELRWFYNVVLELLNIEEIFFVDNLVFKIKNLEESGCIFGILMESAQ